MNIMIVSGGTCDLAFLKEEYDRLKPDMVIGADKGLAYLKKAKINPDLCIGDFDSLPEEYISFYEGNFNTIRLKPEKDFTDTHVALEKAMSMKPDKIYLMGVTGTRLDHTMANISLLKLPCDACIEAEILDKNNLIRVVKEAVVVKKADCFGKYLSVIPLGTSVKGLTMTGFKYETENITLTQGISLGISNEIIDDTAKISFENGYLIIMETKD